MSAITRDEPVALDKHYLLRAIDRLRAEVAFTPDERISVNGAFPLRTVLISDCDKELELIDGAYQTVGEDRRIGVEWDIKIVLYYGDNNE